MLEREDSPTILILGGYGNFGKYITKFLAIDSSLKIIIAGRSLNKAALLMTKIKQENPTALLQAVALDWQAEDFAQKLQLCGATIVIHCAGPFHQQDYTVAQTCIDLNLHYLDLSDAREFVTPFSQLDTKAKEKGVILISGAASVPALSSAVVQAFEHRFSALREIEVGISPANQIELGDASISAILNTTGKPFLRLEQGKWKKVYGWQSLHRHYYGDNLGLRWQANCDIPDLTLLAQKYPTLGTVIFHAGLEVPILHFILWFMSWFVRIKIVKNLTWLHQMVPLIRGWFRRSGTKAGGMYVRLSGSSARYQPLEINWVLVAEQGHGVYLPIIPSLILVRKILQGLISPGAYPCLDLIDLNEFEKSFGPWNIYTTLEEVET